MSERRDVTIPPTYNLLDAAWLPVRCRSGRRRWIAPWQIAETDDPPVAPATGRPELDHTMWLLLIGLLQTTCPPEDEEAWLETYLAPPSPEALKAQLAPYRPAFWLDGDGPRFMQELGGAALAAETSPKPQAIDRLRPGTPAQLFQRSSIPGAMGQAATALALVNFQLHTPGEGASMRGNVRGGSATTTFVDRDEGTLFERCWLNVTTADTYPRLSPSKLASAFPWMAPTRTSQGGKAVTPTEMHPAHVFWSTSGRVHLSPPSDGRCDLYPDAAAGPVYTEFVWWRHGVNYTGPWRHPLTPYVDIAKKDQPVISLPQQIRGPIRYQQWPSFVLGGEQAHSAHVVPQWHVRSKSLRRDFKQPVHDATLRVSGYQNSQASVIAFRERAMPLLFPPAQDPAGFRLGAGQRIETAEKVASTLHQQLKIALYRPGATKKPDALSAAVEDFHDQVEVIFFEQLRALHTHIEADDKASVDALRETWLKQLGGLALSIFDAAVGGMTEGRREGLDIPPDLDIERYVTARRDLLKFTSYKGKKLRALMGLPPVSAKGKKTS